MTPGPVDVLVVEDNAAERASIAEILHAFQPGLAVAEASGIREAMEWVFGGERPSEEDAPVEPPRLVILDLHLAGEDAGSLLRGLRTSQSARSTPVVVFSDSPSRHDIERCYALGANSYVVKPVCYEEFGRAVREIACYWLSLNAAAT